MPLFAERFILVVLAGAFAATVFTNPMQLDTMQRWTLAGAIVFLALFVAHTTYTHTHPKPAPEDKLYSVEIYSSLLVGGEHFSQPYLWIVDSASGTVTGVDVVLGVDITNTQSIPAAITEFSVDLKANGKWVPLDYLPLDQHSIYISQDTNQPLNNAREVHVWPDEIAKMLGKGALDPGKPMRGLILLKYSEKLTSVKPGSPLFRFTFHDSTGRNSVHEVTSPPNGFLPRGAQVNLEGFAIVMTDNYRDLRPLRIQ